jgi:hypothetical protein
MRLADFEYDHSPDPPWLHDNYTHLPTCATPRAKPFVIFVTRARDIFRGRERRNRTLDRFVQARLLVLIRNDSRHH